MLVRGCSALNTTLYVQALPRVRFNKGGALLAVSTNNNGIKILANADGQLLLSLENRSYVAARSASESITKVACYHIYVLSLHGLSLFNCATHM